MGKKRNMKKTALIAAGVMLAIILLILIVFNTAFRKITVVSGEQYIDQCPSHARPGQEVTITTAVVSDGEIYVNGVDGAYARPGVYVFTMPDEDVNIKVTVIADPNGA